MDRKRVGTWWLILAMPAAVLAPQPISAEQHEPLARFWLDTGPKATGTPFRPRRRPPARPPVEAVRVDPQPAGTRRPLQAVAQPDFVVAVFGDAFAASVVRGLNEADAREPGQSILDRTADDAGLAMTDAAAWTRAIDTARAQNDRLDAAIVLVGGNEDAVLQGAGGERDAPGSPAWLQLYGDRVAHVATAFRDKGVALIWVGLPIVRDAAESRLYAAMNEVIRERAVRNGAIFIDSWEAFADEAGEFSFTGPDVNGRTATLRNSNGRSFSRAGSRKLASFVALDLKRLRDHTKSTQELAVVPSANPDTFDQALSIDVNAQIRREAGLPIQPGPGSPDDPREAKAGPTLALTAAPLAKDGLLATVDPLMGYGQKPTERESGSRHAGRADDFTWPRP